MQPVSAMPATETFDEWVMRPEYAERNFELIGGEVYEKMVSRPLQSVIAARIVIAIGMYLAQNDIGFVSGADGGYKVLDDRYIPDVAFMSYARQRQMPADAYNPVTPDLAVEVLSPGNSSREMTIKTANYLAVGTVVWLIDTDNQTVSVFVAGQAVRTFGINDTLDGGTLLPGFALVLAQLFRPILPEIVP